MSSHNGIGDAVPRFLVPITPPTAEALAGRTPHVVRRDGKTFLAYGEGDKVEEVEAKYSK